MTDIQPVLDFLTCRTPSAWLDEAIRHRDALLLDHASLELKAAQQAQRIIRKYGASDRVAGISDERFRSTLLQKMSRLAREELRHFERVTALLEKRGVSYRAISASRYASGLHELVRKDEPGTLVDILLIGAIIEARSCERFHSLVPPLEPVDPDLAKFYASLLESEVRHFEDYLGLAAQIGHDGIEQERLDLLRRRDADLILSDDGQLRFHSGVPAAGPITRESRVRD
jgi:tRNA-(ms[2]io[6]A)-hydroxylase